MVELKQLLVLNGKNQPKFSTTRVMDQSVVAVIVIGVAILAILYLCKKEGFQILGAAYNLDNGGSRSETSDECLQHPSLRMCMMTDGTPGVCMLSGQCVPEIMEDLRVVRDQLNLPYCTKPIFKTGCRRFCECRHMAKGRQEYVDNVDQCTAECKQWFSPLN